MKFLLFLFTLTTLQAGVIEEKITHAGADFRVVRVEPGKVHLAWRDANGQPFRTFDRVQAAYAPQGKSVKFLMNAGIFEPGGIPSGLHIEAGKTLLPLNEKDAPGNFFLKPNGVVALSEGRAHVLTVSEWKRNNPRSVVSVVFAAQSGPMLLIHGQRHPAFTDGSKSRLHRNGVGVDGEGRFVFAITAPGQRVNFWDFAGLFLKLGCQNALFLDGDISQVAIDPPASVQSNPFGAMFVVTE